MLNGGHFVEALGRLGYPGASSLTGSAFDWLFDCAPENLHFMRFICRTLNRNNVVTPEEMRAFQKLKESGKPILDEVALGEVLKNVGPADASGANILGPPTSSPSCSSPSPYAAEDASVEELESELQALQRERKLKQRRHDKLQALAAARAEASLRLAAHQETAAAKLRDTAAAVGAENAGTNAALQALVDDARKLRSHLPAEPQVELGEAEEGGGGVASSKTPGPRRPSVLLSQLSLETYLHQEELSTKALAAFTQRQFFRGISDIVEAPCAERLQLLDLSSCRVGDDGEEGREGEERAVERRRVKMARMQWAYIVAQHQLLTARAEERSIRAGLDWLSDQSSHIQSIATSPSLQVREAASRQELQAVEADLNALLKGPVPLALREAARMLNVPVVRGDLALQLARQSYYTSRQDQVRDYLLRQKASFDLMLLAVQQEKRKWEAVRRHLGEATSRLGKEVEEVALRVQALAQPDLALNPSPAAIICSKDTAFSRLLQILETTKRGQEEPFRTYGALDQAAHDLSADLQATREALAGAARHQGYMVASLHGDYDTLHKVSHTELQQLVLEPQEVTLQLVEAESQLSSLYKVVQDVVDEVKAKRSQLQHSALLRWERKLYIHFHLDPAMLKRAVEELEARATAKIGKGS